MKVSRIDVVERFRNESASLGLRDTKKNLLREILQEVILCHMEEVGLFDDMAFHGGTSLRLIYRIARFSEDLDMSLLKPNKAYNLPKKMESLEKSLQSSGFKFEFQNKVKEKNAIKTFYLNEREILSEFSNFIGGIIVDEKLKIKFELDVLPSDHQLILNTKLQSVFAAQVKAHDLTTCMGQKIHAVLCRGYFYGMDIIKGRDLYDLEWYLERNIIPNYKNLKECLFRGGPWENQQQQIDRAWVVREVYKSVQTKDFKFILEDLKPLIDFNIFETLSPKWNKEYFSKMIEDRIKE